MVPEVEDAEEEARGEYKTELEVKEAKEQLEKAEPEAKEAALAKKAVEDWERKQVEKEEEEKKEKEELDKLVVEKLKERLREEGLPPEQIEAIVKGRDCDAKKHEYEMRLARGRPTWIKVHKKYLHPETLEVYQLPWSYNDDGVGNLF